MLKGMGFTNIVFHSSHNAALCDEDSSTASHVLFETRNTDIGVPDFMDRILQRSPKAVLIPISDEPYVEFVFELLSAGARGLIVPPLTTSVLEEVMILATMSPPATELIRETGDRNRIFAEIVLNNLHRLTVARRHARQLPEMRLYVAKWQETLSHSMELALSFCENGADSLRDRIIESCLARSDDDRTRLSALRRKLGRTRQGSVASVQMPHP